MTESGSLNIYTDISAIRHNINAIKGAASGCEIIAMVKAECYNHGLETALYIENDVAAFGVCTVKEGIELRKLGVKKPIKVSVFFDDELRLVKRYNLTPIAGDLKSLENIGRLGVNADIKINSGMNRLGFDFSEVGELVKSVVKNKVRINEIATHFAFSDMKNLERQRTIFDKSCRIIEATLGEKKKHTGGSVAADFGGRFLYDGIRAGLALYGYGNKGSTLPLKKAMRVTARVAAVRNVKKDESVGYSGLYTADKDVKIGIVRAGYYDGVPRFLRGARVFINGKTARIVGNICMDLFFILLDEVDARVGDEVLILGEPNDAEYLAKFGNTISYEVLTGFKGRITRKYIK